MAKTYHLKNLAEKSNYRYLMIDYDGDVVLNVPVVGGESISTDNTCQATVAQDAFMGNRQSAIPTGISRLTAFEQDLNFDLTLLRTNPRRNEEAIRHKQQRLEQVQGYLTDLRAYTRSFNSAGLSQTALSLMGRSNAHAVLLSPERQDSFLGFNNHTARFSRGYSPSRSFGSVLRQVFRENPLSARSCTRKDAGDPRENIINNAIAELTKKDKNFFTPEVFDKDPDASYQAAIDSIRAAIRTEFNLTEATTPELSHYQGKDSGEDLTYNYLKMCAGCTDDDDISEFADDENGADRGFIEAALNGGLPEDFWTINKQEAAGGEFDVFYDEYVYTRHRTLDAAVQFFFGTANIFARTHGLSTVDFGESLESRSQHRKQVIANQILTALRSGESVEDVLFNFIHEYPRHFSLSRNFTEAEKNTIRRRFNQMFNTIKCSGEDSHFDEFLTIVDDVPGAFIQHNATIAIPFAHFFRQEAMPRNSQRDFYERLATKTASRAYMEHYHGSAPTGSGLQELDIELSSENIRSMLSRIETSRRSYYSTTEPIISPTRFAQLLHAEIHEGGYLFEELEDDLKREIMQSRHWREIDTQFKRICDATNGKSALKNTFDDCFTNKFSTARIRISFTAVRSLLDYTPSSTTMNTRTLLTALNSKGISGIASSAITQNNSAEYFELELNRSVANQIKAAEREACAELQINRDMAIILDHAARNRSRSSSSSSPGQLNTDSYIDSDVLRNNLSTLGFGRFEVQDAQPQLAGRNSIVRQGRTDNYTIYVTEAQKAEIERLVEGYRFELSPAVITNIMNMYNLTYYGNTSRTINGDQYTLPQIIESLRWIGVTAIPATATESGTLRIYALPAQIEELIGMNQTSDTSSAARTETSGEAHSETVELQDGSRNSAEEPSSNSNNSSIDSLVRVIRETRPTEERNHFITTTRANVIIDNALQTEGGDESVKARIRTLRNSATDLQFALSNALRLLEIPFEGMIGDYNASEDAFSINCADDVWGRVESIEAPTATSQQDSTSDSAEEQDEEDSEESILDRYDVEQQRQILRQIEQEREREQQRLREEEAQRAEEAQRREEESRREETRRQEQEVQRLRTEHRKEQLRQSERSLQRQLSTSRLEEDPASTVDTEDTELARRQLQEQMRRERDAYLRGEHTPVRQPRVSVIRRFFRAIYYFFYELFNWCKRLNFRNATSRFSRTEAQTLSPGERVEAMCSPQKIAAELHGASNHPRVFRSTNSPDLLYVTFNSENGGENRKQKTKDLAYSLLREGITGVEERHSNGSDSVTIHGTRSQNQFFQKLYHCDMAEAGDHLLEDLDEAPELRG